MLRNLYDERPHLCKTDGRRFKEKAELTQHMDELFAKNKSKKERTGLKERLWWQPAHEWCEANDVATDQTTAATDTMEVEEAVEEEKSVVVLAQWGGGPFKCEACHEVLKKSWDTESDDWIFRGVLLLSTSASGQPELVHQTCHRASHLT